MIPPSSLFDFTLLLFLVSCAWTAAAAASSPCPFAHLHRDKKPDLHPAGADLTAAAVARLQSLVVAPDAVSLPSGIIYRVVRAGSGRVSPSLTSVCLLHHASQTQDGLALFDSRPAGPSRIVPAAVIVGWREVLLRMVVGDVWEVYVPFYLARGPHGVEQLVRTAEVGVFVLELVAIEPSKDL